MARRSKKGELKYVAGKTFKERRDSIRAIKKNPRKIGPAFPYGPERGLAGRWNM